MRVVAAERQKNRTGLPGAIRQPCRVGAGAGFSLLLQAFMCSPRTVHNLADHTNCMGLMYKYSAFQSVSEPSSRCCCCLLLAWDPDTWRIIYSPTSRNKCSTIKYISLIYTAAPLPFMQTFKQSAMFDPEFCSMQREYHLDIKGNKICFEVIAVQAY